MLPPVPHVQGSSSNSAREQFEQFFNAVTSRKLPSCMATAASSLRAEGHDVEHVHAPSTSHLFFGNLVDQVPDRFAEFEALITRYEAEPQVDPLSDTIKKAVFIKNSPKPNKTQHQINVHTYTSYGSIRNVVQSYTEAKRTCK